MWMKDPSKVRKILNLLIRWAIFLAAGLFIWQRFFRETGPGNFADWQALMQNQGWAAGKLFPVMLIMVVQWILEAVKWRFLVSKIERISLARAVQAVLAGITVSSFLPNRTGEFLGRIYMLKRAGRIQGTLVTLVGSMSQLLVTVAAGSAALAFFLPAAFPTQPFGHGYLYFSVTIPAVVLSLLMLVLYFRVSLLGVAFERLFRKRFRPVRRFLAVLNRYRQRELAAVLLLSLARYALFTAQFQLLLRLFGVMIPYPQAMMLIALVYFIMAIIPTVALTELGVRGSVAVYIFGLWMEATAGPAGSGAAVFAASTLLWFINIGIPALLGIPFVFRLQFFRKPAP